MKGPRHRRGRLGQRLRDRLDRPDFPTTAGVPSRSSAAAPRRLRGQARRSTGNALAYSTYLGGSGDEDNVTMLGYQNGGQIVVDSSGNAWVTA